jgi:altronate hydrolase
VFINCVAARRICLGVDTATGYLGGMDAVLALPAIHAVHELDDVAVALCDLRAGEDLGPIVAQADIPKGHKVALTAVPAGAEVRKYGWPIGRATQAIAPGDHVHTHNLETLLSGLEGYAFEQAQAVPAPAASSRTFMGYRRRDGRVGTRNEIWVLCTVGCVANTARRIAEAANARFAGRVEGVHAFTHPFGCSQLGEDLDGTRATIAALAAHPNAGGVLVASPTS